MTESKPTISPTFGMTYSERMYLHDKLSRRFVGLITYNGITDLIDKGHARTILNDGPTGTHTERMRG